MKSTFIKSLLFSTVGVLSVGVVTPIVISSCGKKIPVTGVKLDKSSLKLDEGEVTQLKANIIPENATNKKVTWSSSDESIAIVDKNGNVKAINDGNATITVTTKDGGHTAICEVTVNENIIHVTSVELNENWLYLDPNESHKLIATVLPENATYKNVIWSSPKRSIATVDQDGNVTAVSPGTVDIAATTEDGWHTSTCKVIVKDIPVTSVTLDRNELELVEGETDQLTATVLPENATNKNVIWYSNHTDIVTVDQDGNVKAISEGNATIVVTTEDGNKTDTCEVNVTKNLVPVTGVILDKSSLKLNKGETDQLTATVLPEDATNKNVTWISDNENVVTVDKNGNVKAVRKGYADIFVATEDGGHTDFCWVVVTNNIPVEDVSIDKSSLKLDEGEVTQLKANIIPENATNKNVTWSSSNESIAIVDENGNVEAISVGNATITVTTEDGEYTDSCTIQVDPPIVIGMNYEYWGNILVKYKLYSNHECRLLTKYNGEDSENGYVDGAGVLRIPDHVAYNGENYYVRRIPSDWSDGENDVNGIEFDNVSHLKEICDYAFKGTNALDNYHHKVCIFPEGLEYIGTEAFYNVDRGNELVMVGLDFPSTLNAINVRAFANAGLIGDEGNPATLMFRGNFNTANMREEVFSSIRGKNVVYYVYAPVMEIAANIANHIRVVYEDDFETGANYLIPKVLGS